MQQLKQDLLKSTEDIENDENLKIKYKNLVACSIEMLNILENTLYSNQAGILSKYSRQNFRRQNIENLIVKVTRYIESENNDLKNKYLNEIINILKTSDITIDSIFEILGDRSEFIETIEIVTYALNILTLDLLTKNNINEYDKIINKFNDFLFISEKTPPGIQCAIKKGYDLAGIELY